MKTKLCVTFTLLGRDLLMNGMFKEAVMQFEKACSFDSQNSVNFELCASAMLKVLLFLVLSFCLSLNTVQDWTCWRSKRKDYALKDVESLFCSCQYFAM